MSPISMLLLFNAVACQGYDPLSEQTGEYAPLGAAHAQVELPEQPPAEPHTQAATSTDHLPRLLIFTEPDNCPPCRKLGEQIELLKGMAVGGELRYWQNRIGPGAERPIQVIDLGCEDSPETELAAKYGVRSWPTTIRLDALGKVEWGVTGVIDAVTLAKYQAGLASPVKPIAAKAQPSDGQHSHKCPNARCGFVWWHGGESANRPNAHRCPKCMTTQFEIHQFRGTR